MIHYDDLIKAEKMGYFSDYETMLFARAKGKIKSVTGVLPLTFTAKGGTAADWVIEGNDEPGENLLKITAESQTVNNVQITINADKTITVNGTASDDIYFSLSKISFSQGTYTLSSSGTGSTSDGNALIYAYDGTFHICDPDDKTWTLSEPKDISFVAWITSGKTVNNLTFKPMFVEGSTAPDHYIPYQQGVGERTENLWNSSSESLIKRAVNDAGTVVNTMVISVPGTYTARCFVKLDKATAYCYARMYNVPNNTYGSIVYLSTPQSSSIPLQTITATVDADNIMLIYDALGDGAFASTVNLFDEVQLCIVKGSTPPDHYIPHGYQIPLTVSQQGQPDKTVDIYIGDSPLTEGETVSKTSTGQDIELFEGENVVSTTLYNKPEMKIEYEKHKDADKNE